MSSLSEDIAVIRTHVEYLRARADKDDKRITALESSKWKVTGAFALGSVVLSMLGWLLKLAPLILLFSCAPSVPGQAQWFFRPVTVLIDSQMYETCNDAVSEALAFWDHAGVHYLVPKSGTATEWPELKKNQITVRQISPISGTTIAGDTWPAMYSTAPEIMYAADVRLVVCGSMVAAHEIGHALGLNHSSDPDNLMYWVGPPSWKLSDEQLEWVR